MNPPLVASVGYIKVQTTYSETGHDENLLPDFSDSSILRLSEHCMLPLLLHQGLIATEVRMYVAVCYMYRATVSI